MTYCKKAYSLLIVLLLTVSIPTQAAMISEKYQCPKQQQVVYKFDSGNSWNFCWMWSEQQGLSLHDLSFYSAKENLDIYIASSLQLNQVEMVLNDNTTNTAHITQHDKSLSTITGSCSNGQLLTTNDNTPLICLSESTQDFAMQYEEQSRRQYAIDIFHIMTLNNHQFLSRIQLNDDGSFSPSVSFITNNVTDSIPYTVNYFWRVDFDIGATANNDTVEEFRSKIRQGRKGRQIHTFTFNKPNEFNKQYDRIKMKSWRIVDKQIRNDYSMRSSYHIFPLNHNVFERDPKRPWTKADVFFTNYNDCETNAIANHTLNCASNIAKMTNGEKLEDVVAWIRLTAHHTPPYNNNADLAPIWQYFTVYPRDIYSQNPNIPDIDMPQPVN
ncbi:hypothetical protein [Photobacterium kishitanii]|uniref:hypothetical protein n=1 Tax=Photobacterium kishitanii TaxID=318456 RepID=UPI000D1540AA|nr:hypothetical protein [Photobacterium kishitanii]PSV10149.1 hypothetical protein C0W28_19610 [Photobacterium kishitanii]